MFDLSFASGCLTEALGRSVVSRLEVQGLWQLVRVNDPWAPPFKLAAYEQRKGEYVSV